VVSNVRGKVTKRSTGVTLQGEGHHSGLLSQDWNGLVSGLLSDHQRTVTGFQAGDVRRLM
jgi:hypothetical protein